MTAGAGLSPAGPCSRGSWAPCPGPWQRLEKSDIYRDGRENQSAFREQPNLQELGFSSPDLYCVKSPPKPKYGRQENLKQMNIKHPEFMGLLGHRESDPGSPQGRN